jgi:2-polyprenyl-3-methyl-5-hydroxy-6-metoxy-1,4-benzoquinol methylase
MPIRIDPEQVELRALRSAASWRGARVLEIGSGDGRLTRRLAWLGAQVIAIDSDRNAIRIARRTLPKSYAGQVRYAVGTAGRLDLWPARSFDIVVFAWSL